jgi:hypothetical protein
MAVLGDSMAFTPPERAASHSPLTTPAQEHRVCHHDSTKVQTRMRQEHPPTGVRQVGRDQGGGAGGVGGDAGPAQAQSVGHAADHEGEGVACAGCRGGVRDALACHVVGIRSAHAKVTTAVHQLTSLGSTSRNSCAHMQPTYTPTLSDMSRAPASSASYTARHAQISKPNLARLSTARGRRSAACERSSRARVLGSMARASLAGNL